MAPRRGRPRRRSGCCSRSRGLSADAIQFIFGNWTPIDAPLSYGAPTADVAGHVFLIGGWDGLSIELLTTQPATIGPATPGCSNANTPPRLVCHRPPRFGVQVQIELIGAAPQVSGLLGVSESMVSTYLGGCMLGLYQPVVAAVLVTDAVGNAGFRLAIPANASLRGMTVGWQAATFEPAGPVFGTLAISDSLRLHVGD